MSPETPIQPDPRVWFDGDEVPAGAWTYRVQTEEIEMLGDDGMPCGNGNLGPLIEVVLPSDIGGIVSRAMVARREVPEVNHG